MPAIRIEGTGELAGNWVDLADVWTRGEVMSWYTGALRLDETVTLPLLQRKLLGVHVHLADGTLLEDAATLIERLDDLDNRLVRWLSAGVNGALRELMALGEGQKRLLFAGVEVAAPMKTTTPA